MTDVAARIGEAEKTGRLDLSGIGLTALPSELFSLRHLEVLDLSNNRLSVLPAAICSLTSLRSLDLSGNQLESLPDEIRELTALTSLDLRDNRLSDLGTLAGLPSLTAYSVDGNPIEDASAVVAAGDEGRPLHEVKVVLVGEGNVGKTSLAASLAGGAFVPDRPTTHGIEIRALTVSGAAQPEELTLRIWDFGGQEVYRVTHQLFFNAAALHVVVWNPREGREMNEVEAWLRRIRLAAGPQAAVLIVATHADERSPDIDGTALRRQFGEMIRGFVAIDNRSGRGVGNLRSTIAAEVARRPDATLRVSGRWLAAREAVLAAAQGRPYIPMDEVRALCVVHRVPDDEVTDLTQLLHEQGHVLHFDDDGLRDIVVTQPEWITTAISRVLEDPGTHAGNGLLDHDRLGQIWAGIGPAYPHALHPYLLRLMEKFDLSYRLHDRPASIVPQLVRYDRPSLPWSLGALPEQGYRTIRVHIDLSEPAPAGLIAFITARHHGEGTGLAWRGGVFLRHPVVLYASEALIELQTPTRLSVEVRAPSPDFYFSVVKDSIERLLRQRWPGLDYQFVVQCPTRLGAGEPCPGDFALRALVQYRERGGTAVSCLECLSDHDVVTLLTGYRWPTDGPSTGGADAALLLRSLLTAAEDADTPRLVSLVVAGPRLRTLVRRTSTVRIRLWCEHLGEVHPADDGFDVDVSTAQLQAISGYLRRPASIQRELLRDESRPQMDSTLRSLRALTTPMSAAELAADVRQLTDGEAQGLRSLRELMLRVDPGRAFGGLSRVRTPSGDLLWVCPEHRRVYDPGLPDLAG